MINNGAVVVQGQKIAAVGRAVDILSDPRFANAEVVDLGDYWLCPGAVEAHNHVAGSLRDLNDNVYLTNPGQQTHEVLEPENPYLLDAVAGGITSALFIPGSGSNMGGFGMLVKTAGKTVEDMVVRAPGSLKIAQAGNPERYAFGVGRAMMNWNTRNTLRQGIKWVDEYRAGTADFNPMYENFTGLVDNTVPISVHTQAYQVVMQTIVMQKKELGLPAFVDHGTFDGFKAGALAVKYDVSGHEWPASVPLRSEYSSDPRQRSGLVRACPRWIAARLQHRCSCHSTGRAALPGSHGCATRRRHQP